MVEEEYFWGNMPFVFVFLAYSAVFLMIVYRLLCATLFFAGRVAWLKETVSTFHKVVGTCSFSRLISLSPFRLYLFKCQLLKVLFYL